LNQILVAEKIYVTPELKRKKKMYKVDFFISVFLVCILFSYYIYAEYDKNKTAEMSQEILASLTFEDSLVDDTTIKFTNESWVVVLNTEDPFTIINEQPQEEIKPNVLARDVSYTSSGQEYYTVAVINIPSINVKYPVLNTTTDELLKISPTRFWGPEPNEVGNLCIVGHNYRNSRFFSKVIYLDNGDIIEITDETGRTLAYQVYDKYIVEPKDVACTSQRTNGMKEITLITCTNDSSKRVIVKAREVI